MADGDGRFAWLETDRTNGWDWSWNKERPKMNDASNARTWRNTEKHRDPSSHYVDTIGIGQFIHVLIRQQKTMGKHQAHRNIFGQRFLFFFFRNLRFLVWPQQVRLWTICANWSRILLRWGFGTELDVCFTGPMCFGHGNGWNIFGNVLEMDGKDGNGWTWLDFCWECILLNGWKHMLVG